METGSQVKLFLIIMLAGAFLGLLFDGYTVLRRVLKPKLGIGAIMDLFYWLLAFVFIFGLLIMINWGEVRFYVYLALAGGAALYYRFFSSYCLHGFTVSVNLCFRLLQLGQRLLFWLVRPIHYLLVGITTPCIAVFSRLQNLYRRYCHKA